MVLLPLNQCCPDGWDHVPTINMSDTCFRCFGIDFSQVSGSMVAVDAILPSKWQHEIARLWPRRRRMRWATNATSVSPTLMNKLQHWHGGSQCINTKTIPIQALDPRGWEPHSCSYRTASPRCPSYKLAEPNVHRGWFLLPNPSPTWPLVTKWVTDFARLASARIRWLDLPFTWMVGTGGGYPRIPGK